MNAAVRAVVRMGIYVGCEVYLIKEVSQLNSICDAIGTLAKLWTNQCCFYARQHTCCSAYMPWQFRLSVRLSVTQVDQSKAFEVRIMQFSPYSSLIPLVSAG